MAKAVLRVFYVCAVMNLVIYNQPLSVTAQEEETSQSPEAGQDVAETPEEAAETPAEEPAAEEPAAEEPAADAVADGDSAPAEENADDATDAEPAPETPEDAQVTEAESFEVKLDVWKSVIRDLRSLRTVYKTADDATKPALEQRWIALLEQANQLLPELRQIGKAAFLAAPNQNRELTRFLLKVADDEIKQDRFEAAAEIATMLIDNDCDISQVFDLAGVALFCIHDFEKAEEYLQEADLRGATSENGKKYFTAVGDYKSFWEREQELRAKDSEANLPRAKFVTSKGEIILELFEDEAPGTVGNFVSLIENGFYDGLTFHRVLGNFVAQGGCPAGDGTQGPGYNIKCECFQENARKHFRGSLSMAHAGRDTGGSQFFLTFVPTEHLNDKHTVFGRVVEGLDVLAELQRRDPSGFGPKSEPDTIVSAEILNKRDHEYVPDKVD